VFGSPFTITPEILHFLSHNREVVYTATIL